jgi:hypothetical protein
MKVTLAPTPAPPSQGAYKTALIHDSRSASMKHRLSTEMPFTELE